MVLAAFSWPPGLGKPAPNGGPGHCKSGLKRLFPRWSEAEEGLRALSNAPAPTPYLTPPPGDRGLLPSPPRGSPPGPWINAACICAADVLLGHEHDFRVKHLSEALNDKHGPLAGEYRSPARGPSQLSLEGLSQPGSADCSAPRSGQACSPLSPVSLSGTRSPCLSPDGSAHLALRAWAKGRSCCYLESGQTGKTAPWRTGSPDTWLQLQLQSADSWEPIPWCTGLGCLPQPLVVGPRLFLGQLTTKEPSLSGALIASSQILTSCQLPSQAVAHCLPTCSRRPGWSGNCLHRPSMF